MEKNLNIRHALLIALGLNKKCREEINKIYKSNEQEYYRLYRKSGFFTDELKNIFSIETVETINKLIGIIEQCYEDSNFTRIEVLIKKVHPSIINYVKNTSTDSVDISVFVQKYLKKDMESYSELELFTIIICLMYAVQIKGKNWQGQGGISLVFQYWEKLISGLYVHHNRFNQEYIKKEEIGANYKLLNLKPYQKIAPIEISTFLDNLIDEEALKESCKFLNTDDREKVSLKVFNKYRGDLFTKEGIFKYLGSFSAWMDTLGIEQMDAESYVTLDNDVINMIFNEFERAKTGNNVDESQKELYIVACLNMYVLAELYKQAKDLYLNKSKEEKFNELEEYEIKLSDKEKHLASEEAKYKNQIKKSKEEIEQLKDLVKELRKENNKLSADNAKNKEIISEYTGTISELKNTNISLNNMLEQLESSMSENNISIDDIVKEIQDYKIAICGGMKGIDRLSNYLPNVVYFKDINRDITAIKNMDYIFINTDFFKHGFTYKIDKTTTEYGYIGGTNIELILKQIYNYIKNGI